MMISIASLVVILSMVSPTPVVGLVTGQGSNAAVQKVISMLGDMQATSKKEKQEEAVQFAEFETFCTMETADLAEGIKEAAEQIELLTSEIEKLTSDVSVLGEEIGQLGSDVAGFEGDLKVQTSQREKEHADFVAESTDYAESIDALDRAITVLTKNAADKKQAGAALLQVSEMTMLPERVKAMVSAFMTVMDSNEDDQTGPPEANAYESQSGGIIDMLKKLQDDFRKQAKDCEKQEMNSAHAFNMVAQDLKDSISRANSDIEEKTAEKEKKTEKIAEDKGMLAATTKDKAQDTKTLSDLEAECSQKAESFHAKQQLRAEEIEAIGKAIEILKGGAVSGGAAKHLSFLQKTVSLIQVASKGNSALEGVRHHVMDFLASQASRLHSQRLGLLAEKIAADPFAKVKKLIDEMITRLLEEANAEGAEGVLRQGARNQQDHSRQADIRDRRA